jgi:hypothetical protein
MPANRRIPPRPAAEARRDLASESQSMRYLTRCHSAEEAAPIERAVAEVVCRLILFRKPMERGSDFLRLGASAAGGLMVWSEYVLDRMIDELQQKPVAGPGLILPMKTARFTLSRMLVRLRWSAQRRVGGRERPGRSPNWWTRTNWRSCPTTGFHR